MNLSLLSRSWRVLCTTGSITFFILQAVVIYDHLYSCNSSFNSLSFARWAWIPNIIESIFFSTLVVSQVHQVMFKNMVSSDLGSMYATIFIGSIGGISSFLNLLTDWTGVSEDVFGVKLPGAIWAEWLVCVPSLYYTVLATDDIEILPLHAKLVLLLITFVFISGLGLQFTESYIFSVFLLFLSFFFFSSASLLFYYITIYAESQLRPQCDTIQINEYSYCLRKMKRKLSICLLCISPLFPMVYLMSFLRIINQDTAYVLFISSNILSKFLFLSTANNAHISINSEFARIKLSSELSALHSAAIVNQTRRLFLRYIMHEVRVPLNSISMGLGYLEQNPNIDDEAREALLMMESASEYMKQTLDEVLNLQSIEEGIMQLNYAPFTIHSVIRKARASVVNILKEKQILLDIRIHPTTPKWVIGDAPRIEVVIANILNNALKFSDAQSFVEIKIASSNLEKSKKSSNNDIKNITRFDSTGKPISVQTSKLTSTITFSITDHGPGIPPEDLPYLFVPFSQIRPHELQCGGSSGIGLIICKQIVELHGGTISCQSTVGVGSTFTITIPFKLCDDFQCEKSEYKSTYNTRLHRNRNQTNSSNEVTTSFDQYLNKVYDVVPRAAERVHSDSTLNTNKNLYFYRKTRNFDVISSKNNSSNNNIIINSFSELHSFNATAANCDTLIDLESSESIVDFDDNGDDDNHIKSNSQSDCFSSSLNLSSKSTPSNLLCRMIHNDRVEPEVSEDNFSLTLSKNISKSVDSDLQNPSATSVDRRNDLHPNGIPAVVIDSNYNDTHNKSLHVLVVDDVSSNRKLLVMLLRKRGITSTMAANGREAVELVEHAVEAYDMIFMDNSMPIMSGVEATSVIRAAGYPNLIIGVTGNAMADDVAAYIAAGADSVILKPLSVHQLQQILEYVSVFGKAHLVNKKIVFDDDQWEYSDI